jgi:glucose/arabinose dehydrogenase
MAKGELLEEPVALIDVAATGEAGLLGLALDPDFGGNHYLYIYYTYRDGSALRNRVVRLVEHNNRASDPRIILDGIPGSSIHDGGRLKFGPDGKLYITTGDARDRSLPQDLTSLAGKILRINADGSFPQDNPFPNSPVYSLGHRNPQGLSWHPATGQLFSTEHGPTGNDEVNIIEAGRNYGWPVVEGAAGRSEFNDPLLSFTPSVAPSGATFYSGHALPGWEGDLFFSTLRGEHLHRITLSPSAPHQVLDHDPLFQGEYGRLRDIIQGPNGFLYLATSNRDGRGGISAGDDRILRIFAD